MNKSTLIVLLFFIGIVSVKAQKNILTTSLTLTVRDGLGNTVENASVALYETEEDYIKEKNVVQQAVTDSKGRAKFKSLKPVYYFVMAQKEELNNRQGGEKVGPLIKRRINKATVVIE